MSENERMLNDYRSANTRQSREMKEVGYLVVLYGGVIKMTFSLTLLLHSFEVN